LPLLLKRNGMLNWQQKQKPKRLPLVQQLVPADR
jgi:hypothetical protein